jgi:hypothetical protein
VSIRLLAAYYLLLGACYFLHPVWHARFFLIQEVIAIALAQKAHPPLLRRRELLYSR